MNVYLNVYPNNLNVYVNNRDCYGLPSEVRFRVDHSFSKELVLRVVIGSPIHFIYDKSGRVDPHGSRSKANKVYDDILTKTDVSGCDQRSSSSKRRLRTKRAEEEMTRNKDG